MPSRRSFGSVGGARELEDAWATAAEIDFPGQRGIRKLNSGILKLVFGNWKRYSENGKCIFENWENVNERVGKLRTLLHVRGLRGERFKNDLES